MLLDPIFQPFLQQRPICVLARAVLQRILDPAHLDAVCQQTGQQQDTHELLFSTPVEWMSPVILSFRPSVHAAYRPLADRIPVSDQAVCDKLPHVELAVSRELVRAPGPAGRSATHGSVLSPPRGTTPP